jgi:predicted lipoprotein with Yx(FWY)xxD motif
MRNLLILLALFTVLTLNAQIQWTNEVSVRRGENIEWYRSSAPVDGNCVVYTWSDTRNGDRDVWVQKMDSNGNEMWNIGGVLVNGEINRQEDPVVIHTGNGEVIIAWVDFRNEDAGDVYAQKLDANGNLQWDAAGVPLCLADDIQITLNIIHDENGGAFIIWLDHRNTGGNDIYGIHILANGTIASGWSIDGNPISTASGSQNQHTFWEDGSGGGILAWHDERNANDENIYVQRISSDGNLLWDPNGILLCNATGIQESPKMAPDGTGSFIFSWRDKRGDLFGDIYAQRVDISGNLLWTSEIVVYAGDGVQRNARITKASDTGAIVVWEDGRNEIAGELKDIYAQKISTGGTLQWNVDGVSVAVANYDQINPRLIGDNSGGAWIIWEDGRIEDHPWGDIYIQHFNSSGTALLNTNGNEICNAEGYQFSPIIKVTNNDVFCVWGDNRDGSTGLYIQLLDFSANIQLDPNGEIIFYGLCGDALNYQVFSNGNQQIIVWEDTRNATIAIQIYYQVLNEDGSFVLDEDGKSITTMTGFNQDNMNAELYPGSDILCAVWEENKEGFKQIYTQTVDLQGNFIWSDSIGIQVAPSTAQQITPQVSIIEEGGSYEYNIGWEDFTDAYDSRINGQKIIDGQLQWGPQGVTIVDRDGNDELCDIVENFYIWQSVGYNNENIFCKLVDENGITVINWDDDGLEVCVDTFRAENARGILVPEGLLIVWDDLRNGDLDIYAQLVTFEGAILWEENGIPLVNVENDQQFSNMIFNEDDGLFMVWDDFRTGTSYDVYMQKYDNTGAGVWQENGLEVVAKNSNQQKPYLTSNGEKFMVFWEDYDQIEQSNLKAQMVDANGVLQWPTNGFNICNAIKNQNKPMAVTGSDGYVYVIWEDTRSSGKTDIYNIYAQKIKYEPVDIQEDEIPTDNRVISYNYPNPFKSSTAISFNINPTLYKNAVLKIYNIKGQQVKSIKVESNNLIWNGKDNVNKTVANGIYFYMLEADNFKSKPGKMILLK